MQSSQISLSCGFIFLHARNYLSFLFCCTVQLKCVIFMYYWLSSCYVKWNGSFQKWMEDWRKFFQKYLRKLVAVNGSIIFIEDHSAISEDRLGIIKDHSGITEDLLGSQRITLDFLGGSTKERPWVKYHLGSTEKSPWNPIGPLLNHRSPWNHKESSWNQRGTIINHRESPLSHGCSPWSHRTFPGVLDTHLLRLCWLSLYCGFWSRSQRGSPWSCRYSLMSNKGFAAVAEGLVLESQRITLET